MRNHAPGRCHVENVSHSLLSQREERDTSDISPSHSTALISHMALELLFQTFHQHSGVTPNPQTLLGHCGPAGVALAQLGWDQSGLCLAEDTAMGFWSYLSFVLCASLPDPSGQICPALSTGKLLGMGRQNMKVSASPGNSIDSSQPLSHPLHLGQAE